MKMRFQRSAAQISKSAAAFTLMEVMLAVAVSAIVLTAIGGVFFSALKLRGSTLRNLDESRPIERALNILSRDLKNVVPPAGLIVGPMQSGVVAAGITEEDGIQFFTSTGLISDRVPWGDVQKVSYQLQQPADRSSAGLDLYRSVTRNLLATGVEEHEDQRLASGIADLRFAYFDGSDWLETWDSTTETNLPYAVRVQVQLASQTSANDDPIELIVPLMAQMRTNTAASTNEAYEF